MRRILLAGLAGSTFGLIVTSARWTRWQRRWGTEDDEAEREMPGDGLVERPNYVTTRAITVEAPPECIYPWLKQMGYQRGGLYSWDFLDRLFGFLDAPSATEILPEFQDLQAGDLIPLGRGRPFPVAELRENEAFVLGDREVGWSWATCLYPQPDGSTRLVTRNRGRLAGPFGRPLMFLIDLAAFVMVTRWLAVLKQRAERLAMEEAAGSPRVVSFERAKPQGHETRAGTT